MHCSPARTASSTNIMDSQQKLSYVHLQESCSISHLEAVPRLRSRLRERCIATEQRCRSHAKSRNYGGQSRWNAAGQRMKFLSSISIKSILVAEHTVSMQLANTTSVTLLQKLLLQKQPFLSFNCQILRSTILLTTLILPWPDSRMSSIRWCEKDI